MNILFWLAGLTLVFSVASHTTLNLCQSSELHLVIVMTCQFQAMNWNMIKNIFKLLKPTDSENATRKLTVTLIDILSLNNITLNESNINNVSEFCHVEDYDESNSIDNALKLQAYILGKDNNSSKLFIIYLLRYSKRIYLEFYENVINELKFIKFLIILLSDEYECCEPTSHPYSLKVDIHDDLKNNNWFSLKLCSRCLDGWFPILDATKNSFITSCILFEKRRNLISWQYAANYCKRKRSHLFTFETSLDFELLNANIKKSFKNFTKDNFQPNGLKSIIIYLGLHSSKDGNYEQLLWINKRRVNSLVHFIIKNVSNSMNTTKVCFAWNYNSLQNEEIFRIDCGAKITKYVLCEQEFKRLYLPQANLITHSEMHNNTVPNNNFIITKYMVISVSNVRSLPLITFPTFVCDKYFSISYNYVCDGINDCYDGEDEQVCTYEYNSVKLCLERNQFFCPEPNLLKHKCIAKSQVCDMIEDCPDGSDESNCDDCILTQCSPSVCIPDHWTLNCSTINYLIMNETSNCENQININVSEPLVHYLLKFITLCSKYSEENPNALIKQSQYNSFWTPTCIYMRDRHGTSIGCSDLSHLSNCTTFICHEGFFKCWNSYCIPDTFVLDDVIDCPLGEDEVRQNYYSGSDFSCYYSFKSIHPIYVCDGKRNCLRGDDELNCINPLCPSGFICMDGTVTVNNTNILFNMSSFSPNTTFLNISGIDVSRSGNIMDILILKRLLVLVASRCHINDKTQTNAKNSFVYYLDISYNDIAKFTYKNFILQFSNLRFLNVSYNENLSHIPKLYFPRLQKLVLLDLSFTKITRISLHFNDKLRFINFSVTNLRTAVLSNDANYEVIDLRKTRISDTLKEKFFNNITVKGKVLADYKLCCSYFRGEKLLAHQCEAEEEPLSSCEDLIGDSLKRVFLWIVAICAIFGNMIALGYRILFEWATLHQTYVLFVTFLGVSDLLMGIYLVIIASVDVVYRDVYIVHEMSWKQSTLCQIAGTLATLSSETSTFFILLITLERFLTIRFPFGEHKISNMGKYILISLAWGLGFLLSVIPTMYDKKSVYSTNGMCLGFPLRKSSGTAWIYSVTVFLFFNSILFVVIAIGQFLIFLTISQHSSKFKTESQDSTRRADNITVALKLSVVVLSNFICWFPVCIMGIRTVVSDYEVSREAYSWIITLVLPFNSALNPVLYTLPRISRSWTDFKYRKSSQLSKSRNS
ncbi:G-protein coupled receptor GRL101 [Biomphalaria glabrata]